jgi:hypothetical protein
MGDRASILFFDSQVISPTVYLHWHGSAVPDWLRILQTVMSNRTDDASYAAARFVGICHERINGNLSLGIQSNNFRHVDLNHPPTLEAASPGNAGFVVVDTRDFTWRAYGGYLASSDSQQPSTKE